MRSFSSAVLMAAALAFALSACAGQTGPAGTVSPQLDSGVTSNNGGGARTLGNNPGVSITTRVGATP